VATCQGEIRGDLRGLLDSAVREQAVAAAKVGAIDQDLCFAGVRVRLSVAGGGLLAALRPALLARQVERAGVPDVTVALWERDAADASSASVGADPVRFGARRRVRDAHDESVLVLRPTGSEVLIMIDESSRLLLQPMPPAREVPWWERAAPLRSALDWALSSPGSRLVHAGAVGRRSQGAVLLVGASGSGKSTVALAAVDRGLDYVGDDYVLLRGGATPLAYNLFGTAKLDDGHRPRFPHLWDLAATPETPGSDEKAVLDVGAHWPDALAEMLPVRAIVVPQIRGGRASIRPIPSAAAFRAAAPSTALQLPYEAGETLRLLAEVCRNLPCFSLGVGDRPAELADAVERLLTSPDALR
jgi:hypothetical protein